MEKNIELEDFIPSYPYLQNGSEPSFNYPYDEKYEITNLNKSEFLEDILQEKEERPEQKGVPLKHQEFLARFLSPKTLNDEMLLFHQVGTGKTCTAISIAELCASMNPSMKKSVILVKGETFIKNFTNELAFQCTTGQYVPENYEKLTSKEKIFRLNRNIRNKYEINTFYTFAKEISKYSDEIIEKNYSNRVIIIDEVHNIKDTEKKRKEEKVYVYKQIHRILHLAKNRKIILLSATPMKDNSNEFASILNLILPLDRQLPRGKEFNEMFFQDDKLKNIKKLKEYIRGKVSFLRTMESEVVKMNIGKNIGELIHTLVDNDTMSEFQSQIYESAFRKDKSSDSLENITEINEEINEEISEEINEDKRGLYDNSRQASLFVFPNGKYGSEGYNDTDNMKNVSGIGVKSALDVVQKEEKSKKAVFSNKLISILTKNNTLKSPIDILNEIGKYSSKYKNALEHIILHPKENCFVYSKFVKGSGLVVFSELLKLLGYKESKGNEDITRQEGQVLRFALLTEKITEKLEKNIKLFNTPENRHGKYIQVLLGSPLISEGRSFYNVRQIHILTPHWNISETEQAIGRGIRAFSHRELSENERFVKVYRHCSFSNSKTVQSIDYIMYKISEDKDIKIKQIERICKESAVDCAFNKQRNSLITDKDGSRECEYKTCKYVCDNIPDVYIQQAIQLKLKDKILSDTYNLYYGENTLKTTINLIQQLFKRSFFIHIKDLMKYFGEISFILLIRSLKYMIQNYIPIINKYGLVSYLKYERNVFFLTDYIQSPNSFYVNYYCANPPVYICNDFKSIILQNQSENSNNIIQYINSLDINNTDEFKKATDLILEFDTNLQEQLIELSIFSKISDPNKKLPIRDVVLQVFNSSIIEFSEMYVSIHHLDENLYRYILKNSNNIDDWKNADVNVINKIIEKESSKVKDVKNIEENPFRYYGYITKDQKFKIKQTEKSIIEEKSQTVFKKKKDDENIEIDKRVTRPGSGAICNQIVPTKKILNIILKMYTNTDYFNIPDVFEIPSEEEMKKYLIRIAKYTDSEMSLLNLTEIQIIYYWLISSKTKQNLCESIQKFFEKNNLIIIE